MMMMMKLAEATANVHVYVVRRRIRPVGGAAAGAATAAGDAGGGDDAGDATRRAARDRRLRRSGTLPMANLACYPAITCRTA